MVPILRLRTPDAEFIYTGGGWRDCVCGTRRRRISAQDSAGAAYAKVKAEAGQHPRRERHFADGAGRTPSNSTTRAGRRRIYKECVHTVRRSDATGRGSLAAWGRGGREEGGGGAGSICAGPQRPWVGGSKAQSTTAVHAELRAMVLRARRRMQGTGARPSRLRNAARATVLQKAWKVRSGKDGVEQELLCVHVAVRCRSGVVVLGGERTRQRQHVQVLGMEDLHYDNRPAFRAALVYYCNVRSGASATAPGEP